MHILLPLAVIAAVILIFLLLVLIEHIKRLIEAHGVIMLAWRYFSGLHHTGQPQVTVDGKPLNQTGHVRAFWLKPRRERARIRCTRFASALSAFYGLLELRLAAYALLGCLTVYRSYRAHQAIQTRRAEAAHHRNWVQPLHLAVHELCGQPRSLPPATWITVERNRSRVEFALPEGVTFTDRQLERVVQATAAKLALANPRALPELEGSRPRLIIESHPAPPDQVTLAMVRHWLDGLKTDELLVGLGARSRPVTVSLSADSPHLGLSMRTGKGKSRLARFLIAQALARGWLVVVIDSKRFSQQWCKGLPGVIYARTAAEIHEAMVRLGQELEWRNEQAEEHADDEGEVGHLWPRVLVVCEEMNMARSRLLAHWRDTLGGAGTSPADRALAELAYAGRQVLMNIVLIAQRLSAQVAGGGDVRENIGARMLNCTEKTWKMLSEHDMPPMPKAPGRFWLVVDDDVREVQGVNISAAEARELAMSGTPARPWHGTGDAARPRLALPGETAGQPCAAVSSGPVAVSPSGAVALSVASLDKGLALIPMTLEALRTARARRKKNGFPEPVSWSRGAEEYDPDELARWYEQRYGQREAA